MSRTFPGGDKGRTLYLAVSPRIIKCHDNYSYGSQLQLLNETQSAQLFVWVFVLLDVDNK